MPYVKWGIFFKFFFFFVGLSYCHFPALVWYEASLYPPERLVWDWGGALSAALQYCCVRPSLRQLQPGALLVSSGPQWSCAALVVLFIHLLSSVLLQRTRYFVQRLSWAGTRGNLPPKMFWFIPFKRHHLSAFLHIIWVFWECRRNKYRCNSGWSSRPLPPFGIITDAETCWGKRQEWICSHTRGPHVRADRSVVVPGRMPDPCHVHALHPVQWDLLGNAASLGSGWIFDEYYSLCSV